MKRIFVFSYHGKETFQTSYYRLLSLSEYLAQNFEVYFIHGTTEKTSNPINIEGNFIEIPLNYAHGLFQGTYKNLLAKKKHSLAKVLLIIYYFFTGEEIFDLGKEFQNYIKKTNLVLTAEDKVIVSYPSLAIHNLGMTLKKKFGCKLILDYRDPGVFGYQHISENKIIAWLRKSFLKGREIKNLQYADLITTISDSIKALFPNYYQNKIEVIKNGYLNEKADLTQITSDQSTFKLVYLGTIYNIQLKDFTFFKAVRSFIDQNQLLPHQFQIKFIGARASEKLNEVIAQFKLDPYTLLMERMAIEAAYQELYDAGMFFHLKYGDRNAIITSKQYEYLAFQKPILLPVNDHGDLEESINDYKAGYVCNNEAEIIAVLAQEFKNHQQQKDNRVARTTTELYELSRKAQEEKLQELIYKM